MTDLIAVDSIKTINSINLCELINRIRKEEGVKAEIAHSDLLKKIKDELDFENIEENRCGKNFLGLYIDKQGKERPCFNLPQKEALQVIASESKRVRRRLIDEIEKLTIQNNELKQQVPTNLKDALLLAYNQQCKIEEQKKEIEDKQETIELISTNSQERTYKKELRANIVNIIRKVNKQTGAPFSLLYDELYKRFINNHHFEWKLDFYKSKNKLDYICNKDINYLKELKDISITLLN